MKKLVATTMLLLVLLSMSDLTVFANPYSVPSTVRGGWSQNYGSNSHDMTKGLRLSYDVYNNKYLDNGFRITSQDFGKGSLQYLNFTGWSVLFGYKRHTSTNNQTYIVARKVAGKNNIGSTKIYRANQFGNLSATEDLEYNNQGAGGVWNECPVTTTKKDNLTCNMRYDNVGFSSYIPIKELFPDAYEQAEWALFIVKKVDSWMVYTQLKTPFSFSDKNWNKGKLSLKSGGQANLVKTQDYPVIRRTYPRQPATATGPNYYTVDRLYQLIDEEETQTTVWYGLRTPEDGNAKRWANSVYFGTAGTQARIKYTPTQSPPPPPSKPDKPDGICKAPVTPKPRYNYQFDFEAREIDGKTAQPNSTTSTKVTFFRHSFATERNAAKADIQDDIKYRQTLRSSQQTKLNADKTTYSNLSKQYDQAIKDKDNAEASRISTQMEPVLQRIANYECSINSLNVEIAHYQTEYNNLVEKETTLERVTTSYTLKFEGVTKAFKTIGLYENEFSYANLEWILESDGFVEGNINSNRYSYHDVTEETYDNNMIETPIYVASNENAEMCAPLGEVSEVSGVVRTINNSETGEVTYGERISTTLSIPNSHLTRKAGYGFDYTVTSQYTNEDPTSVATGTKEVKTYFPSLSNYLPYPLKTNIEYGNISVGGYEAKLNQVNAATFKLPNVYLEKFSGNAFDSPTSLHPSRNTADTLINGGMKHYIPFEQPDGDYTFNSIGTGAGVNNMTTCVTGNVTVDGTPINDQNGDDDFYQRPLSPEEPFPNGVGWNMQANQAAINSMKTWYSNWSNDPFNPSASYKATYYLTGDVITKIQKYAETNPLQKGKSMFNQISIPRKK
jgi:hypothetical protein